MIKSIRINSYWALLLVVFCLGAAALGVTADEPGHYYIEPVFVYNSGWSKTPSTRSYTDCVDDATNRAPDVIENVLSQDMDYIFSMEPGYGTEVHTIKYYFAAGSDAPDLTLWICGKGSSHVYPLDMRLTTNNDTTVLLDWTSLNLAGIDWNWVYLPLDFLEGEDVNGITITLRRDIQWSPDRVGAFITQMYLDGPDPEEE